MMRATAFTALFISMTASQYAWTSEQPSPSLSAASSAICATLTGPCHVFLGQPTIRLAESVLFINDMLVKQYVKEVKDEFYPDPKRKKKDSSSLVFGTGTMGPSVWMSSNVDKFPDADQFYQALALMKASGDLKNSLKDCIEAASQYLDTRWDNPIAYLNDEHANPASPYYRQAVDSLPLDVNIYRQLNSKGAKRKFVEHILLRDQTNFFEYICGSEKEQPTCPYQIRDANHPFVCRHFSRYMFHKYRFNPMNYDNELWEPHYHLAPVDEKFRIPIREVYIDYPDSVDGHAINAVYLGDNADPDADANIHNWHVYEPQTDMPMSLRTDEAVGTKYYLLKNSNAPLLKTPASVFDSCSGIEWANGKTDILTKTNQECNFN